MKLEVKFKRFRRKCIVYIRQQYKGKDGSQPFEDWKLEDLFQAIMQYGCKYDISKHIKTDQYRHELIEVEELCSSDPFRTRSEREQGTSQKA